MNIVIFAGSLRAESYNKKLAREAARLLAAMQVETEFLDLKDYPMPPYDGDIEETGGLPETTKALSKKIAGADALIISTPEYNASIPGTLKNVIDWLSRDKPVALTGKHLLLLAASPGALGGIRVLWNSRQTYDQLQMHTFPDMMALPEAHKAFDENGKLSDPKTEAKLKQLLEQFVQHVKR